MHTHYIKPESIKLCIYGDGRKISVYVCGCVCVCMGFKNQVFFKAETCVCVYAHGGNMMGVYVCMCVWVSKTWFLTNFQAWGVLWEAPNGHFGSSFEPFWGLCRPWAVWRPETMGFYMYFDRATPNSPPT